jgi:hypothetical protein
MPALRFASPPRPASAVPFPAPVESDQLRDSRDAQPFRFGAPRDAFQVSLDDGSPAGAVRSVFAALKGHVVKGVSVTDLVIACPTAAGDTDMDILVAVAREMVERGEVPLLRFHRDESTGAIAGIVLVRAEANSEAA